jgi:signal transduction histidine kinase
MKKKKSIRSNKRVFIAIQRYTSFFFLMSFVVTCCMLLFLNVMQRVSGFVLTEELIRTAARLTFGNVVIISLLCTVIDGIRRKFMIERPVRRIVHAADQVMRGNLTVRIPPIHSIDSMNGFDIIADYFNHMTEELSGMETLRTDFIANVSHELKTPLAVIQNYGTMLQQKDLPEEKRLEYAKAITDASRNLANLITNILKLNKLENQEIYPNTTKYDLSEQLCECLLMFEDAWEQKNLEIETDIKENVTVNADEEMLSLVWNNLFSNAIKFTEAGGRVSLSVKSEDDFAIVKVSDTGCGISRETGAHIFEKFYQGDTSHATKGNGLGLALVKRVMDITGGDISVESEVDKGSTFTVKIRRNGLWNNSNGS